ncbi:putative retrotransposon hobase [Fusarium acutatum]|uniref:Putative retrotransposon hobase n=1 Tax=Fusarium acutatum TaxID=78861 RepID=A0A8H4J8K7_9HYPO|nr:putative retrotransposon hobase [Fusarium acutatum]
MSSTANTKTYLLNGPADWDSFEQSYIMKTSAERVYELGRLADPNRFATRRIKEPKRPEFGDYLAKEPAEGNTRPPRFVRGERPATAYIELLPEDQEAYKVEMTIYRSDLDRYNKQADSIRNVLNWMIEKISPHYVETCSPATNGSEEYDNISQFFNSLKDACGINDDLRRKQARKHYFEVLKKASNVRINWEEWITSWEKGMRIAKLRGVAEAQHPNTWFDDLQQALEHHFKIFLRIEYSQNKKEIENGTYLPLTFSSQFRTEIQGGKQRGDKATTDHVAKGSFGTTFRASSLEDRKRSRSTTQDSREGSAKRPRPSRETPELCILCERNHKNPNTTSCWIAFPEKRPKHYQQSEKQQSLWKERLEQKKEVRDLYERLQHEEDPLQEKSN